MATKVKKTYPWDQAKIILTCGSGGVGKTSVSAAMALDYARRGFKTVVLTVDPAARLAQALGFGKLSSEPQRIFPKKQKAKGSLDAMMLDTKRMFDKIIRKYAQDKESCKSILNHPLYDHLSNMLAGSQEYMAMENLHQIVTEYDYEKIIVDTPPSTHALDFFDAPERMVNAITNSMLKTLVKPSVWAGHKSGRLLSMFGSLTGTSFFQEMSDFLAATVSLLDGFKDRAESVMKLMTSDETELVLVATATPGSMHDAFDFIGSVLNRQLTFAGCIINRVSVRPAQNTKTVEEAGKWCKKQKDKELQKIGNEMLARGEMYKMEKKLIGGLAKKYSRIPIYKIPQKPDLIHSIKGLNDFYSEITKD